MARWKVGDNELWYINRFEALPNSFDDVRADEQMRRLFGEWLFTTTFSDHLDTTMSRNIVSLRSGSTALMTTLSTRSSST